MLTEIIKADAYYRFYVLNHDTGIGITYCEYYDKNMNFLGKIALDTTTGVPLSGAILAEVDQYVIDNPVV